MQTLGTMRMMSATFARGVVRDLKRPSLKTTVNRAVPRTDYDPTLPEVCFDPYPGLVELRTRPVHINEKLNVWMLARYADVAKAVKSDQVISSASGVLLRSTAVRSVVTSDNPDHEVLRRIIAPAFSPSAVRKLEAKLEAFCAPGIDALASGQVTDAVESLTVPLPVSAIATVLGVEASRWPDFRRYSGELLKFMAIRSLADMGSVATESIPAVMAMRRLIVDHLNRPGGHDDDVIGRFKQAIANGQMSELDAITGTILILFAGNETTTNLLGIFLMQLARDPELHDRLRENRSLIPAAVEEAMRLGNPVQWVGRRALAPYQVGDVTIPANARVVLFYAGANRDPERFANPDRFDLERGAVGHLGFGSGVHTCAGANLARLEMRTALNMLFDRVKRVELVGNYRWTRTPSLCGPTYLPMRGIAA